MLDSILKSVAFFGLTVFVSAVKLYLVLSVCDIVAVFKSSIVCQVFSFFFVCVCVCHIGNEGLVVCLQQQAHRGRPR